MNKEVLYPDQATKFINPFNKDVTVEESLVNMKKLFSLENKKIKKVAF